MPTVTQLISLVKKAMTSKNLKVSSPSLQKQQTYSNAKKGFCQAFDVKLLTELAIPLQGLLVHHGSHRSTDYDLRVRDNHAETPSKVALRGLGDSLFIEC